MKTAGIIAEFNPFHNGHKYLIDTVRQKTGAENIIILCSGNFVQRGLPAIFDKSLRDVYKRQLLMFRKKFAIKII